MRWTGSFQMRPTFRHEPETLNGHDSRISQIHAKPPPRCGPVNGTCFKNIATQHGAWPGLVALCFLLLALNACHAQGATEKPPVSGQTVWLTMIGYNYTDHYIDNYSVNGAWGGNVFISDSDSGGSKDACCVRWVVGQSLPVMVHIRWESSACVYTKNVEGENFERAKQFYSEKDVSLKGPIPSDPQYFETHFYPDGHVEVAITSDISPPRLKLAAKKNGLRPGAKPWPKCTPGQLKQGED